jgi:predicted metal-binding membrane protein
MHASPGTQLGPLGWFLGIWVTMTAAMMLPSTLPVATLFARLRGGVGAVGSTPASIPGMTEPAHMEIRR